YDAWRYYYLNDQAPFFRSSVSGLNDEHPYFPPPLQQLTTGIGSKDVVCKKGLVLVIKSEDGSPACAKPDTAQKLIERGWAKEIVSNGVEVTTPKLYLSTNSTIVNFGHTLGIDIWLNNTRSEQLTLAAQNHWIRNDLSIGSCSNLPVGIAILKGYYTEQNITDASSLWLFPNLPCPMQLGIKSYTFQPLSNVAIRECDLPFSCHDSIAIEGHLAISSYLNDTGYATPFQVGNYTVAGGDEWGNITIKHFMVTNSTG
ncbi:MAG TPA: hypothetical protein VJR22_05635, partial [Candidatus Nitrosotalea sp.]|nr:hypothetical protein [Candidatus Nitrosotalea sp.]